MNTRKRILIFAAILALLLCALAVRNLISAPQTKETALSDSPAAESAPAALAAADEGSASAATVQAPAETGSASADSVSLTCRIISGAETGNLLLAAQDGSADVYRLNVSDHPLTFENSETADLQDGMLLEITHGGIILETYPAQFGDVREILVLDSGMNNLCELYLQVLNDLWETDPALNADITELGVDLSSTCLSESEQAAVALAFGEEHDLFPVQGTYDELADMGYINDELLYWENGCLFSITQTDLPFSCTENPDGYSLTPLSFNAQKWRSGTGACFFTDCTSVQSDTGIWDSYRVGGHAIS